MGYLTPSCIFDNKLVPLKADVDMEAVAFLMYTREMEDEAGVDKSKTSSTINAVFNVEEKKTTMETDDILEEDSLSQK